MFVNSAPVSFKLKFSENPTNIFSFEARHKENESHFLHTMINGRPGVDFIKQFTPYA
jgi:hypothetical protein